MSMGTATAPDVLVSTDWVAQHLGDDPSVRLVEVDVDTAAYDQGHVPGAIGWNWTTSSSTRCVRDIPPEGEVEKLLARTGIDTDTTVVLYGDNNNWFAAWAFWQLKIYGHKDARIMNGGPQEVGGGRPGARYDGPRTSQRRYRRSEPDHSIRAFLPEVQEAVKASSAALVVDVRCPQEFSGELLRLPAARDLPARRPHPRRQEHSLGQGRQRRRHLQDSRRAAGALRRVRRHRRQAVIAYCRIGERSSHTWFVLKYLLGSERQELRRLLDRVGQPGGAPIEKP